MLAGEERHEEVSSPRVRPPTKRTEKIRTAFSKDEKKLIEYVSFMDGRESVAAYIRSVVLSHARRFRTTEGAVKAGTSTGP